MELDETQTLDSQTGDGEDISDIDVSDEEEVEDKSKKSNVDKKLSKVNHLGETPLQQAAIAGNESKVLHCQLSLSHQFCQFLALRPA